MAREEKYSYSKLETYEGCPFKYFLKYIEKHNVFCENVATAFGKLIHATEESIANSIKAHEPINYVKLKNDFILKLQEIKHKYPTDFMALDKSDRTYQDKAYFYLETGIYRLENFMKAHPTYEVVGAEISFKFLFKDSVPFGGFIDRVFRDTATNKYIIQDIKTYAVPVEHDKLVTPLQFVVYALAAKELYGATADQIICQYDLPLCDLTQDAGTAGFVNRGINKISKLFGGIGDKDFAPKPTPLCHWCEFCSHNENAPWEVKLLCPYFSHWTKEVKDFSKENEWAGMENHAAILEAYHKKYQNS